MDSRGNACPAWHNDIVDLNLRVLNWVREYHLELATFLKAAMSAVDDFVDRLLRYPRLPSRARALLEVWQARPEADHLMTDS